MLPAHFVAHSINIVDRQILSIPGREYLNSWMAYFLGALYLYKWLFSLRMTRRKFIENVQRGFLIENGYKFRAIRFATVSKQLILPVSEEMIASQTLDGTLAQVTHQNIIIWVNRNIYYSVCDLPKSNTVSKCRQSMKNQKIP